MKRLVTGSSRQLTLRYLLDGALLSLPPVVTVWVFLLPRSVRSSYAFDYADPTLLTALTANYVHFSVVHVSTTVLGYLLIVTVAYLLSRYGGFGDLFRVGSIAVLISVAPALSVLNLAVPRDGTTFGFSGVTMAFYGLLCFSLGRYVERHFVGRRVGLPVVVFFATTVGVAVAVPSSHPVRLAVVLLAGAGLVAYTAGFVDVLRDVEWRDVFRTEPHGSLTVAGSVLVCTYPLVAFPVDPQLQDGVINVYTHFLGLALGFLVIYLTDCIGIRLSARTER